MERQWTEQDSLRCCGSTRFAREMVDASPFPSLDHALLAARHIWFNEIDVNGWIEAFAAHPEIGSSSDSISQWSKEEQSSAAATATDSAMQELMEWNARYREKFGFVFLICASGRGTPEIIAELKKRYANRPIIEFEIAAQEEMKVIELRLAKLFEAEARAKASVTAHVPGSQPNRPGGQQSGISANAPKKANWTPEFHKLFISLCLDQIVAGNKPGTLLNEKGWKNVMDGFYAKTGLRYDKKQFKSHWDATKDLWRIWNKLKSDTAGCGWDENSQSVNRSDEWWSSYLRVHPRAAQFRYKRLPYDKFLDSLYSGVPVVESITWASSETSLPSLDLGSSQATPNPDNNDEILNMVPETQLWNQESPSFFQGVFDCEPPLQRRKMNQDLPSPIHL